MQGGHRCAEDEFGGGGGGAIDKAQGERVIKQSRKHERLRWTLKTALKCKQVTRARRMN